MTKPTEPTESIEFDVPDDASELTPPELSPYRPLLAIWHAVLEPAVDGDMRKDPISPQWATKMVTTYPGIAFADVDALHHGVFDMASELAGLLNEEIASDDECLKQSSAQDDCKENAVHYRNLLAGWQLYLLAEELLWRTSDPAAAVKLATLSEVQQMFLGQSGLVAHLDTIGFEFTESDQAELAGHLAAARQMFLTGEGEDE